MRYSDQEFAKMLANMDLSIAAGSTWTPTATPRTPIVGWANEHEFQQAVIAECDRCALLDPDYGLIYAIPNGQVRPGQRIEAGLRAGMPDLCLPTPRHGCGALYIELKLGSNKPSRTQLDKIAALRAAKNHVVVVWDSVEEVMRHIEWYLG